MWAAISALIVVDRRHFMPFLRGLVAQDVAQHDVDHPARVRVADHRGAGAGGSSIGQRFNTLASHLALEVSRKASGSVRRRALLHMVGEGRLP
jgi:hypothetical protein